MKLSSFATGGFSNWKDGTVACVKHESSVTRKLSVDVVLTLPATNHDVGEMLSSQFVQEQTRNRRCMPTIAENLRFLSRQGIAIRGDGNEGDSNFHQLLLLRSADNPELAQWLDKKKDKYTSPEIQNEVLKVMAISLSRSIAETGRSCKFFALMADEVADVSNKEQVQTKEIYYSQQGDSSILYLKSRLSYVSNTLTMILRLMRSSLEFTKLLPYSPMCLSSSVFFSASVSCSTLIASGTHCKAHLCRPLMPIRVQA